MGIRIASSYSASADLFSGKPMKITSFKTFLKIAMSFVIFLFVLFVPFDSLCWMRDADIAHSKDSFSMGWAYDGLIAAEKIIDKHTSVGLFYFPTPLGGVNYRDFLDISYNKQIFSDGKTNWALFIGIVNENVKRTADHNIYWESAIGPEIGVSYKYMFDDKLSGKIDILYFLPFRFNLSYLYSNNLELSLGIGMTGLVNVSYLF